MGNIDCYVIDFGGNIDGCRYIGSWYNGFPNGKGQLTYPNGNILTGTFKDGQAYGTCKIEYNNGYIFEGEFMDGKRNGHGRLTTSCGDIFDCEYVNDEATGYGKYVKPGKYEFEGMFKAWMPNGFGRKKFYNGYIFEGRYKNGNVVGAGVFKFPDGTYIMCNTVKGDVANGMGKFVHKGVTYSGIFKNNEMITNIGVVRLQDYTYTLIPPEQLLLNLSVNIKN